MKGTHTLEPLSDRSFLTSSIKVVTPTSPGCRRMKGDKPPSRGAQCAACDGAESPRGPRQGLENEPREDAPPPSPSLSGFQIVLWAGEAKMAQSAIPSPGGPVFPMETQPTRPAWRRGRALTCAPPCECVSGVGTVSFSCLRGARGGEQHRLPAPHEDASLAAAVLFCFLPHSTRALPPSSLSRVRETPSVSLIY